jgi:hypothetical protein
MIFAAMIWWTRMTNAELTSSKMIQMRTRTMQMRQWGSSCRDLNARWKKLPLETTADVSLDMDSEDLGELEELEGAEEDSDQEQSGEE